jgi:2-succinyl-5-enolpyruvyl-6-hydroxy-3-cyclohexene-1-carboxylate synthase
MNSAKKGIRHLAAICSMKGITYAVISPGSRNAPIIAAFLQEKNIECFSIADERSAAFFALGIAQQSRNTVAIICTSGSAVLNYAPAIAEAFYQKVPLLVITADRPNEWIDQGENQSIHQYRIYQNFIRKSVELPVDPETDKDIWYSDRLISEAINATRIPEAGPVHVNVPLREPLYDMIEETEPDVPKIIDAVPFEPVLAEADRAKLYQQWREASKKLIIVGSAYADAKMDKVLLQLAQDPSVIILSESTSNINIPSNMHIGCIDRNAEIITQTQDERYTPEILISFGGGNVSKKIKFLFRKESHINHWHISLSNEHWDTFQNLSCVINESPLHFLSGLSASSGNNSNYRDLWLSLDQKLRVLSDKYIAGLGYSDFRVFHKIIPMFPADANIQYGNSTPVRYSNLFDPIDGRSGLINANRGVSGIDGVSSTAAGAAYVNAATTICISGDVAFLYDSNALWNHHLSKNLKFIVINNGGGNIFRIIPGPQNIDQYEKYIETKHSVDISSLVKAYGLHYLCCENEEGIESAMNSLLAIDDKAAVLEIKTPAEASAAGLKHYFKFLIQHYE